MVLFSKQKIHLFASDLDPTMSSFPKWLTGSGFVQTKFFNSLSLNNRRDGVGVGAYALQSVDLGFIPLVESYQKTLKNIIYSFPAWRSAFMGGCGEQTGKFACCVLGQST